MSEQPIVKILVEGRAGTGKTSIVWLLADFLEHAGFKPEIWSHDLETKNDALLASIIESVPDRLEKMIERDTKIIIQEGQWSRKSEFS